MTALIKKERPDARAIFGGTFDPVHDGHVEIIGRLSEIFGELIVVPAKQSPFKPGTMPASDIHRVNMLRLALDGRIEYVLSQYEIDGGFPSYSYRTIEHYRMPGESLYFVIGSDMLADLDKWSNIQKVKSQVTFFVIERPGFPAAPAAHLREMGFNIEEAGFSGRDISSSEVRVAVAFGKTGEYVPPAVAGYIVSEGLYGEYSSITSRYPEFDMKLERVEHTYRAVREGIRLAKIYNESINDVIIALLLHDIAKYTDEQALEKKYGIKAEVDREMPESCKHAPLSAAIAEYCFGIKDRSILLAIAQHTTGAPGMSRLSKIVAVSDYIEEGRDFEGLEEIRAVSGIDLDVCMEMVLANTIRYLSGKDIYYITLEAYEYFKKLNENKQITQNTERV